MVEISQTTEDLKCFICLKLAAEPYTCCLCGGLMCDQDAFKSKQQCPMCKGFLGPNPFARKVVAQIKTLCNKGCGQSISVPELQKHI